MFNSNFNNGGQAKLQSTNTRLATWSCDYSCLQIRLWDDNMSLTFNVCTGKNADGRNQYDFQNKVTTAITPERAPQVAQFLSEAIYMIEHHDEKPIEPTSMGFDVGVKGNRLVFSCEVDSADNKPAAFVRLYNVGPDGKSNDVISYKFKHYVYYDNYNPKTGEAKERTCEDELYMFMYYLNQMSRITTSKYKNHAIRYNRAIEAAFSNNSNGQGNGFPNSGNNNSSGSSNYSAPVQNLDTGDEYPF